MRRCGSRRWSGSLTRRAGGAASCSALRWEWVDLGRREIRLPDTKNGEGRVVPIAGELVAIMARLKAARRVTRADGSVGLAETVFHATVKPITRKRFTYAWNAARKAAKLPDRLFHDFRRAAARRLTERAGVPQAVSMQITGHKTAAMFRRYSIVEKVDMARGLDRVRAQEKRAAKVRRIRGWAPQWAPVRIDFLRDFGRDAGIRTRDPLNPIQVRYQTAPHPDRRRAFEQGPGVPVKRARRARIAGDARPPGLRVPLLGGPPAPPRRLGRGDEPAGLRQVQQRQRARAHLRPGSDRRGGDRPGDGLRDGLRPAEAGGRGGRASAGWTAGTSTSTWTSFRA